MVNARAIRQLVVAPLLVVMVGALGAARAQPTSDGPVASGIIDDLVTANRILAIEGVLDGLGHVSIRHPDNPDRYLLARSIAPALITAADIMEYDLDSNPIDQRGRPMFLERFIHGEAYRARPDVKAVIHSHSPTVIPFSISQTPLQPVFNGAAFLSPSAPVFEIRKAAGMTDGLVSNGMLGKALAGVLGDRAVALMRGHGNVVVGPAVQVAVYRAVYTELNARLQLQAISLGGPLTYLAPEEAAKINARAGPDGPGIVRTWELWKRKALGR
jgi:ribulose-5-phosphate 4-epimerase/fuculose-1-phosphate aldolase